MALELTLTGANSDCMTKQLCSEIRIRRAIVSEDSGDWTVTRLSNSRGRLWIVPASAEPSMWKRVVTCTLTSSISNLRIFPNRESWVSSQKAIDEEK